MSKIRFNPMRGPKSLKRALLLATSLLVIGSGILISQVVIHRYSRSLTQAAVARAENIAHNLALDAADKILINDLVALQKLLDDQIASDKRLAYLFIAKNDQILTHTFKLGIPEGLIAANFWQSPQAGHLEKIADHTGEKYLDIAWPIFEGNAGTLRLGFANREIRSQIVQLRIQVSAITVGILVAALLGAQLFVSRLTRPLSELTAAAEKIDAGNLESKIRVKGRAEITQLAHAFNSMLKRLKGHTRRLENTNRQLERQNTALDRAHHQLRSSFAISQDIAALPNLQDICFYLIETFGRIVECQMMALFIAGGSGGEEFLYTRNRLAQRLPADNSHPLNACLRGCKKSSFLSGKVITADALPTEFSDIHRFGVFPFRFRGQRLGALLVGCPGKCNCIERELEVLELILKRAAGAIHRAVTQEGEIQQLRYRLESKAEFSGLIGRAPQMQTIYKLIEDVAPTDANVLIQGESGTGKELVANAIHRHSERVGQPFIVINCSAYPSTLLESELFGHEKGAFTGALRRKAGRFEQADRGTVFLDEIGEISPSAQIKLLRVLQTQSFERLGGEQQVEVNVRILAATNRDLEQEVKAARFREDLFYRLNVIPINLPPLRQRPNDIPLLARHFIGHFAEEQQLPAMDFSSGAMRLFFDYSWPGNVRELENAVEHAAVLAKGQRIEISHLPAKIIQGAQNQTDRPRQPTIIETERKLLEETLTACGWNKKESARRMGISRSTLYNKLRKHKITKPTIH